VGRVALRELARSGAPSAIGHRASGPKDAPSGRSAEIGWPAPSVRRGVRPLRATRA